jgi:hypothetical protein
VTHTITFKVLRLENVLAYTEIIIRVHNFEGQRTRQGSMACVAYVMVLHCASGLLQGSVVSYTMSLVPAGRSVVTQFASVHICLTFCQSSKYT